jgi:hypothetical protein
MADVMLATDIWIFVGFVSVFLSDIYPNIIALWFSQPVELEQGPLRTGTEICCVLVFFVCS